LHTTLKAVLRLLAPIAPFVTDYIYREIYGESVHTQTIPKHANTTDHPTRAIIDFNEQIWSKKKEQGKSLRDPIKAKIPDNLKDYAPDLKKMHNL
jgi:valyl-tRNA synthetase